MKKVKISKILVCIFAGTMLLSCHKPTYAQELENILNQNNERSEILESRVEKGKDFKEDKESAEKWAEKEFEKWNKMLNSEEKKAFKTLEDTPMLDYLRVYGTDLSGMPIETKQQKEVFLEKEQTIDKALSLKEAKLNETLKVYQSLEAEQLIEGLEHKDIWDNSGKIINENYQELKNELKIMRDESYKIADIAYTPRDNSAVKLEITLPKKTNVGYAYDNQVVLKKDQALEVTKISRIIEKGKEKIKIEAKLIDKEKVETTIVKANDEANIELNKKMAFSSDTKLLDYRFTGPKAGTLSEKSKEVFKEAENRIDSEIFSSLLSFIKEKNGKIMFVDRPIATYPEIYESKDITAREQEALMGAAGLTVYGIRTILMDLTNHADKYSYSDNLVHEFGHMFDELVWMRQGESTDSKEFLEIFALEGKNLTDYGATNEIEFFAEAFRMYYSKDLKERSDLEQNAPQTYKYIKKMIASIKEQLVHDM
ncbi:ADP-ribosyltransferase [Listeria rocourtiae]|uniref:anthrax toxin lethal factor-related metalloendopeptidase n=1 Tax=Listeria rocourtiae TaxID=647910 RepID=UPI003D2F9366